MRTLIMKEEYLKRNLNQKLILQKKNMNFIQKKQSKKLNNNDYIYFILIIPLFNMYTNINEFIIFRKQCIDI